MLRSEAERIFQTWPKCAPLYNKLLSKNEELWMLEDKIRYLESISQFDEEFIDIARKIYTTNDERAIVKRQIDFETNSRISEEKSHL